MTNHLHHIPAPTKGFGSSNKAEDPAWLDIRQQLRRQGSDVAPSRRELREREDTGSKPTPPRENP